VVIGTVAQAYLSLAHLRRALRPLPAAPPGAPGRSPVDKPPVSLATYGGSHALVREPDRGHQGVGSSAVSI